jgi:hypothetical protein
MTTRYPEVRVEQSPDGAFRRQANRFRTRFGDGPGEARVEAAGKPVSCARIPVRARCTR